MNKNKVIHPNIKDSRVLTYLNARNKPAYVNTEEEELLLQAWHAKYVIAKKEFENSRLTPENLKRWRDAYEGKFYKLDDEGDSTNAKVKAVRKVAFELVENKVNSHIPAPKMKPRYFSDIVPVNATEKMIMHELDKMLSESINDEAEHAVLIDGFTWFKVYWDPFDNTHERSGNPKVKVCPVDTVFPQPGVKDYKRLEYIFEETLMTLSEVIDLYGREIKSTTENDLITVVNCYYLNEDRLVGKFSWCEPTLQVICNDLEWGIRRRRQCIECGEILPTETICPTCGSKNIKYVSVKSEVLEEPLKFITNPYRSGVDNENSNDKLVIDDTKSIPAGTILPHYLIRQLPFVPYRRISVNSSIYGISEVELVFENQDLINKFLNKAEKKSGKSKSYVTKLKDTRITDDGTQELSYVDVESPEEGSAIQVKQVTSDISEEITMSQLMYDIAKSTTGVTDTDQGKNDPSARSGKAKQLQLAASAQRNSSPGALRNGAFSGVYELIFKYMLAYSDETRSFVKLLPDGSVTEEEWSKYMFLAKDKNGEYYYRDDFAWSVDSATEITQDRAAMWQLIDNDFLNGTMGTSVDPVRALKMYWHMKDQTGYPLAKFALAFLEESVQHLPTSVEQALINNPDAVELALSYIRDSQKAAMGSNSLGGMMANLGIGSGGARENAGRKGNGATHSANVEKNNNKNRSAAGNTTDSIAASTGGMQGGTSL